jgi:predicted AlkP superfamily phosphohydrolase/phosphomutase/tetratricopeptide (TPR) repeat protein
MAKRLAKKVLVIGWDAADWKVINPLLDSGQMPALQKLIDRGAMGKIATLDPPLSPILWTSIGTGKTADKHGVLNFIEPIPDSNDIRPVSVTSRKVKAIWNILTQQGFKTHLVGWWPSHPAEPINGVCVSNFFQKLPRHNDKKEWTVPPGAVHPAELKDVLSEYRVDLKEITGNILLPFVPDLEKVDQEKDKSLHNIAGHLSEASSIQAAATWIMENEPDWDFMGVYFDMIDHFCHSFMKFHPPRMNGIPEDFYELYKDVINSAYRFQDMMLERMVDLAGQDATIIVLSDHGFHSDHLRPKKLPQEPIAPALEHSPYGVLCMAGPGITTDERIFGATLLDITPTILTLFGLPIGKDMDGKPLLQAFSEPVQPEYIESWENVEGNCGMHPPDLQQDPWAAREAMEQLIELGYVEAPGKDAAHRVKQMKDETQFILARVYSSRNKFPEAIAILEALWKENPDATRYALRLAHNYQQTREVVKLRSLVNELRSRDLKNMPQLDFLEGTLLLFENKPRRALEALKRAEDSISHMPNLHLQLGNVYLKIKKWADAERAFRKALEIDINSPHAYQGLASSLLRQKQYEEAAEAALSAIALQHNYPEAHYHLGEALYYLGIYERAAEAFQVTVSIRPGTKKAHMWLIKIYEENMKQPEKAEQSREFIKSRIKGSITIVSGLPRSGTSMAMQMLNAAGLEILTDNLRQNDNNNPKGYYEYDKVKRLAQDNSWLHEADGKVVKVISHLLQYLPDTYTYKIIFMQREMKEVLKSQQKMLGKDDTVYPAALAETFKKQLEKTISWVEAQPNMELLFINYSDVISNPEEQAENINDFLGGELDTAKMTAAIDKELYRNKVS